MKNSRMKNLPSIAKLIASTQKAREIRVRCRKAKQAKMFKISFKSGRGWEWGLEIKSKSLSNPEMFN